MTFAWRFPTQPPVVDDILSFLVIYVLFLVEAYILKATTMNTLTLPFQCTFVALTAVFLRNNRYEVEKQLCNVVARIYSR